MKTKLLFLSTVLVLTWIVYSGFTTNDDSPRWNPDPRTRIDLNPQTQEYTQLPQVDFSGPVVNEPQYFQTQQGIMVVNSAFRVHPITSGHQTEVPITRHPSNPLIMFGSANTSRGGNFSTGWYVTTDGGTTWFGNDTLMTVAGTPVFNFGDPGPVIDGTGRLINSYITLTGQMGSSFSTNNGVNWSSTTTFPSSTTSSDKNFSSTDDVTTSSFYLRSYTYYTEFASGANLYKILGTYTTNQGVSWTTVAPVSPTPAANRLHQGADTKVGPNGEVYVVWANSVSNVSPFTEDSLGFAKSTNGGVSWTISRNNAVNVNGNRTFNMMNNIRVAGFPRIDVDRTCGPRAGWIYVCMGEKSPGVAGDISDITMYKSTNGGTNWSTGVRVNQDAFGNGRKQYMGAIRVDESGGVNIVYYDTRNTPTNDSAEVYLSRSTDGGVTFVDTKVGNKFRHAPTGVAGVNTQYAGDYIGITSALIEGNSVNGNQRIWPYWMANNSGVYNAWTAKVELIPSNPCWGCENFTSTAFTPKYFNLEYTGSQYWVREAASAYGAGSGSARFDCFNAPIGTTQSLVTHCEPTPAGYSVTFDEAYAPYSVSFPGPDSLYVESSTNGGTTYTVLAGLAGLFPSGGELNTAPATVSSFIPTASQWAPKVYSLPTGTNTVRLRARSGFGNNIFVDNICISPLAAPVISSIGLFPEGFFRPVPSAIPDTVRIYLKRVDYPNVTVDSAKVLYNTNAVASPLFTKALTGPYYIVVKHRNSIETWSKAGGQFYTRGASMLFDFVSTQSNAYNSNTAPVSIYFGLYGGDLEQNGFVDLADVTAVSNDASFFATGYILSDLTGDNLTDLNDMLIAYNNNTNFVSVQKPAGAEPAPAPYIEENYDGVEKTFENDLQRQKYEDGKRTREEMRNKVSEKVTPKWYTTPPENYIIRKSPFIPATDSKSNGVKFGNP